MGSKLHIHPIRDVELKLLTMFVNILHGLLSLITCHSVRYKGMRETKYGESIIEENL